MKLSYTLWNPSILYIAKEQGDQHSKIGVCSSLLWERLRKLQQGNPRDLQMQHLWLGEKSDIECVEKQVKERYSNHKTEWTDYGADVLKSKVDTLARVNDLVYLNMRFILPYRARTSNQCPLRSHNLNALYNAGRLFPDEPNIYVGSSGDIYQWDNTSKLLSKKLWPLKEEAA